MTIRSHAIYLAKQAYSLRLYNGINNPDLTYSETVVLNSNGNVNMSATKEIKDKEMIEQHQIWLENRITWIHFLLQPERQKLVGRLRNNTPEEKCCLGHGHESLFDILQGKWHITTSTKKESYLYDTLQGKWHITTSTNEEQYFCWFESNGSVSGISASERFVNAVGLHDSSGVFSPSYGSIWNGWNVTSLVELNDNTDATPQQIGQLLASWIYGGPGTCFQEIER